MKFTLFGFPVRVDVSFFFIVVLLGLQRSPDLVLLGLWVSVVFISILTHELGHAWAGKRCGMIPSITLHTLGGLIYLDYGKKSQPLSTAQSIAISLAGPATSLALGGAIWLIAPNLLIQSSYLHTAVRDLIWVNGGWGLLNLLPMLPLDGGQVMEDIVKERTNRRQDVVYIISIVVGAAATVVALYARMFWACFVGAWMTYMNFTMLQQLRRGSTSRNWDTIFMNAVRMRPPQRP